MSGSFSLVDLDFVEYRPFEVLDLRYNAELDLLLVLRSSKEVQVISGTSWQLVKKIGLNRSLSPVKVFWGQSGRIIIVTADGLVYIYELHDSLNPVGSFTASSPGVWNADYKSGSFDGDEEQEVLALCGDDGTVAIYVNTLEAGLEGRLSVDYRLHTLVNNFGDAAAKCLSCQVSMEEKVAYAGYSNGNVKKYKLGGANPTLWSCSIGKQARVWTLKIFNREFIVAGGSEGKVAVVDSGFGAIVRIFTTSVGDVTAIFAQPSDHRLFFTGFDSRIFLVHYNHEEKSFDVVAKTRGQTHEVNALEFLPKRGSLISAGKTSDVCFYKLDASGFAEGEEAKKRHETQDLRGLVFYCKSNTLGYYLQDKVALLHVNASGAGKGQSNGDASKTGAKQVEVLFEYRTDVYVNSLCYSQKHRVLACSLFEAGQVKIFNIDTGKVLKTVDIACAGIVLKDDTFYLFDSLKGCIDAYQIAHNSLVKESIRSPAFGKLGGCLDKFELSQSKNAIFLANVQNESALVHRIATSETKDVSFLFKDARLQLACFYASSEKLFLLSSSYQVSIYSPFKDVKYKVRLTDLIPKKIGNVKGVVFHPVAKDRFLLYSDYYFVKVDAAEDTVDVVKRPKALLHMGMIGEGSLIAVTADWKRAARLLGDPISTKKFLK